MSRRALALALALALVASTQAAGVVTTPALSASTTRAEAIKLLDAVKDIEGDTVVASGKTAAAPAASVAGCVAASALRAVPPPLLPLPRTRP